MKKHVKILLVEDNEGDVFLITEALIEGGVINEIDVARDGQEAIEYLEEKKNASAFLPDLILLDINLPRKNGLEVLKYIKADDNFKRIPIIMLTTSSSEIDINESYKNYANCFITKPVSVESFLAVVWRFRRN
nr:response regulator [uncultured Pedobacter sp.]